MSAHAHGSRRSEGADHGESWQRAKIGNRIWGSQLDVGELRGALRENVAPRTVSSSNPPLAGNQCSGAR
jgi:hypothetical protein